MDIIYSIFPIDDKMESWLIEQKVSIPKFEESRNPTYDEIINALNEMNEYSYEAFEPEKGVPWDAVVSHKKNPAWSELRINEFRGENQEEEFHFAKGWPEVVIDFLLILTRTTGPMVLTENKEDKLVIVIYNLGRAEVLKEFKKREE